MAPQTRGLEALESLLQTRALGRPLRLLAETTSTSEVAYRLAQEGAPHGLAVVAEAQTFGRGRRGRGWVSPPGLNLYLSLVLRPPLPPARAPEIPLVAAVAACEALREAGADARIKWPNDLQIGERKAGGILCELSTAGSQIGFVILGIGLNLNLALEDLPEELRRTATSLRLATGGLVDRPAFAAALLSKLERWLDVQQNPGFAAVRARWSELSSTLGLRVRADLGVTELVGIALGIDESGALLIRLDDGRTERVVAGDVERVRPADR